MGFKGGSDNLTDLEVDGGTLSVDADNNLVTLAAASVTNDLTVGGDIILDDGGSLKEAGGTAAITFDGSGNVTKLSLAAAAVAVANDHIVILDGGATGAPKAESIQDLLSAIAGSGISVSGNQLVADGGGEADAIAADNINAGDAVVNIKTSSGAINIGHADNDEAINIGSTGTGAIQVGHSTTTSVTVDAVAVVVDSADTIDIDAADEITIDTTSADGHIAITSAHTAGDSILISANANAGSILDIDAGIIDIDVQDTINIDAADEIEIATTSADGHIKLASAHTSGLAFHIDANADAASEVQIDAGVLDIDVTAGIAIDGTTVSIDGTDDSNLTVTASGKDLDIAVAGGSTQELRLASAGTGASALHLNASAGSVDIDSADAITVDAADEIVITTTSADGHISLVSAHTSGVAFHIDANADAASEVQIDAGVLDIDVTAGIAIDGTTLSIDGTDDSNITVTASAKDLDIAVAGGGTQELRLASAGTGASALHLNASAGSVDIDSADAITVDAADEIVITTTSADGHISLVSAHTSGVAFHIDANADAASEVQIDAGVLDIDVTAGIAIDGTTLSIDGTDDSNLTVTASGKDLDIAVAGGSTQELRLASAGTGASALHLNASAGSVDIDSADNVTVDAADEITITTTSADGHISLVSAHTAGVAFHIDANANAGSVVDIDAGVLDIDVTGVTLLNTTGLTITDTTASSATEGGSIRLVSDDTALMADGHRLGVIEFAGAEDGSATISIGARIEALCRDAWDGSNNDANLLFYTTDGTTESVVLTLDADKQASFVDNVALLSDSAVLKMGADNDVTFTHDGTTGLTIAANPFEVDSGGNITLDAHTGIFVLQDANTEVLRITEGNSGDVTIKLATDGKDLVFTDNGDATNMKILDAAAGINVPGEVQTTKLAFTDGDDAITIADGGGVTFGTTSSHGAAPAASGAATKLVVRKNDQADNTAVALFTVTVPNGAHTAGIFLNILGSETANKSACACQSVVAISRVSGAATAMSVVNFGGASVLGKTIATGGDEAVSDVAVTVPGSPTGANGATQTFDILLNVTTAADGQVNLLCAAELLNDQASGITIAAA